MNCTTSCRRNRPIVSLTVVLALAGSLGLVLPGCGGNAESARAEAAPAAAPSTPQEANAEPGDPGARTRQGLYLTTDQAQALARRLDDRLVTVQARCCGADFVELDVLVAFGVQAAADLPNDVPFVVRGSDLRQAAAVANRLVELGARQAYLVTR